MRNASTSIVYCAIDEIISTDNRAPEGFEEFLETLVEWDVPCVWVTSRNRMQLDTTIRIFGHSNPFIAEGGAGAYIPADYFHLKPSRTTRLGRFICIPVAKLLPAAAEALEELAEATGVTVVPLRSLSPRELSQNTGFAQREAELLRQRDFDELFFFAGTSPEELKRFQEEAGRRGLQLRPRGALWSLCLGANMATCFKELSGLYDRALRGHAATVGIATEEDAKELFACCDRGILLAKGTGSAKRGGETGPEAAGMGLPAQSSRTWEKILEQIPRKRG